jgi:pSer/pThr/pTyr-binding forkhead associated (FHA) protein
MKFKLVRVAGGADVPITRTLVAGRLAECDIQLTQGLPSRRHGQLSLVDNVVWAEDLGSANGTFVNGTRIAAKTALRSGDVVRFDEEEFRLHVESDEIDAAGAPTMYRAPPPKLAASPPPVAPSAPVAKQDQVAESSGIYKRPGAWADPDSDDGANKTKFMDPAALKAMIDHAPKADTLPRGEVDSPSLIVLSGAHSGTKIKLQSARGEGAEWRIGSGAECEVQFTEEGVSALHAKIVNDGQRWKLVDQMSANGSYVNGKRSSMVYLSAGDRISIGPTESEFQLPASARQGTSANIASASPGGKRKIMLVAAFAAVLAAALLFWVWGRS